MDSEHSFLLQHRKTPAALVTSLSDVLLADASPEDIVVGQAAPSLGYLSSTAKGGGVQVLEYLERNFLRENDEGVDANQVGQLLCQKRQLRETAHGQQAMEDEGPSAVRRRREIGPYAVDRLPLLNWKRVQGLQDKEQSEMFGPGRETYRYAPAVALNLSLHRPFSGASRRASSQEGAGVLWGRAFG
jgi:hypothetical protein